MSTGTTAIDGMKTEHRLIEGVLGALESFARALRLGESVEQGDLHNFVRFLREFADAKHHAKEEDILFITMADAGFPVDTGPVSVMLSEHRSGRALVSILSECADEASWGEETKQRIQGAASEFISLLRAHIQKEDNVLYEMARKRLSEEQMDRVDRLCKQRDAESTAAGTSAELALLASELMLRYS